MSVLRSTKEEHQDNILVTSENTAKEKKDTQLTIKLEKDDNPNLVAAKLIQSFAKSLVDSKLLEWHKVSLKDGRKGFALFFPTDTWEVVENEILPIIR